mgnify:CR=1 FL=1
MQINFHAFTQNLRYMGLGIFAVIGVLVLSVYLLRLIDKK